ncbi:MAG: hypothetical protein ACLT8P_09140 [Holdemanella porci]|uniref:hypothetical protein n=1 Tax=Holdemanella porci TaxID=2652276 RepID=UPI0039935CC4
MNVHFIDGTHVIGDENRRAAQVITKRIVVGAGSLVTTNLEDNAIYFGRPARLYKKL